MTSSEKTARYYARHRTEILARKAEWYEANRSRLAKKRRTPKFRARRAAYMRGYRAENF